MTELDTMMDAAKRGAVEEVRSVIDPHPRLINEKDTEGATALHYAALGGHHGVVELLVDHGANVNAADNQFGAAPAGWAIEYLRELGSFLGIELDDFAFAIRRGDAAWVARWLKRFPRLRDASDPRGKPFRQLAQESGNTEIAGLFAE